MYGPDVYYDRGFIYCLGRSTPRKGWPRHGRYCYLIRTMWYELTYSFGQLKSFRCASVKDKPTWYVLTQRLNQYEANAVKKRESNIVGHSGRAAGDESLATRCPALFDHLTALAYEDDGSPRQTSTLLLFAQDGLWKAFLRDREAGEFLAVSGGTFGEAIDVLEAALADGTGGWRKDRQWGDQNSAPSKKNRVDKSR